MAAGGSGSAAAAVPVRDEGPLVPDEAPLLPAAGWVLRPEPPPEKRHLYAVPWFTLHRRRFGRDPFRCWTVRTGLFVRRGFRGSKVSRFVLAPSSLR